MTNDNVRGKATISNDAVSRELYIRRYRPDDSDDVWRLHNLALADTGTHPGNGPWDGDLHDVNGAYLSAGGEFLVGLIDGELVAMGALHITSDERAEIKRMRVHPEFQRQGFGRAILQALEQCAAKLGYSVVHLDTTVGQIAAQGLYEQSGYTRRRQERVGAFELVYFEKTLLTDDLTRSVDSET